MKPENILRFENDVLKICDFGLAVHVKSQVKHENYIGTRWYRAPECVLGSTKYDKAIDVFAAGWILLEFFSEKRPVFKGITSAEQMDEYWKVLGTPTQKQWPEGYKLAKKYEYSFETFRDDDLSVSKRLRLFLPDIDEDLSDLISQMLEFNPRDRITAKDALKHKYFAGLKQRKKSKSKSKTKIKAKTKPKKDEDPKSMVLFEDGDAEVKEKRGDELDEREEDEDNDELDKGKRKIKKEKDIPDTLPPLKTPKAGEFTPLPDSPPKERRQIARVDSPPKAIKLMRLPRNSIPNKLASTNVEPDLPPLDPDRGNEIVSFSRITLYNI